MKFIKKPDTVEAFRYGFGPMPHWMYGKTWADNEHERCTTVPMIDNGDVRAAHGDYIVKGIDGEIIAMKAEVFESLFEKVLES